MINAARPSRRAERAIGVTLAAALVLAAAPLHAAALCHDLKGLFTPCAPGERSAAPARIAATAPPAAGTDDGGPSPPVASTKPPRIAKTKLCRDLKGLFTPCPG